jgi:NDP-sugar pyrophosphorylase family protein
MEFAIIAAGEGARLKKEGSLLPKPLVLLQGKPLIDRLIDIFKANGARKIHIIINETSELLQQHLLKKASTANINLIVRSTPDSLHSFGALIPGFEGKDICLTTVDTVFHEAEFSTYLQDFAEQKNIDASVAVTTFVDDEKPLYVKADETMWVRNFMDENTSGECGYVSGGIYCLRARAYQAALDTLSDGKSRMRDFQRRMIVEGMRVRAFEFSKIVDVDHLSDLNLATQLLQPQ